jgi:drug/metabolite transporter (DMT)-like permease
MWTRIAWRSNLPIGECEQRLGDMPKRALLLTTARQSFVVARTSGHMFRLFIAGPAMRVFVAPYFHGFLIDKHGATEIRGRLFPAPLAQAALFGCTLLALPFVAIGFGLARGSVVSSTMIVGSLVPLVIGLGVVAAGWRGGRLGSALIAASIEKGFDAHRLT